MTDANLGRLRDRLLFVRWDPHVGEPTFVQTAIAVEGFTIPVIEVTVPDFAGVFGVLAGLRRQFPARLLRRLKEHVYELVLTSEPDSRLYVQDIADGTDSADIDVVFGVGMVQRLSGRGYVGLSRRDLLVDVLREHSEYDPRRVVDDALPLILRSSGNTPMYRYLHGAGMLDADGELVPDADVDQRVGDRVARGVVPFLIPKGSLAKGRRLVEASGNDLRKLIEANTLTDALYVAGMIPREDLDVDLLRRFLQDNRASLDRHHSADPTAWAKLVCLYDFYAHRPGQPGEVR